MISKDLIRRLKESRDDLEKSMSGSEIYAIRNGLAGLLLNNLPRIIDSLETVEKLDELVEESIRGCGECDHHESMKLQIRNAFASLKEIK
jgi:hypothetical protein